MQRKKLGEKRKKYWSASQWNFLLSSITEQNRIEWNGSGKPAQPSAPATASALASGYIQSVRCGEELKISNSTILLAQTSRQATQNWNCWIPKKKKTKNKNTKNGRKEIKSETWNKDEVPVEESDSVSQLVHFGFGGRRSSCRISNWDCDWKWVLFCHFCSWW